MMFGVSSMTAPLRKVAVKQPSVSLKTADPQKWHYGSAFDPQRVADNHSAFVELLQEAGTEIFWFANEDGGNADAVFTYDASLVVPSGAILMSPGKIQRQNEQMLHKAFYQENDIPVIGEITGSARAEAGDTLWLDENTLIIGRGFRTNAAGVEQLQGFFQSIGVEVHVFDLPVYQGAAACLHLMSIISLVDTKVALVCLPLLPVGLLELLNHKGFSVVEAPFSEFCESHTLSANVLATAPGQCIMVDGFHETQTALTKAGIEVSVFDGNALCVGCEGGPTCLTRPLLRG